MAEFVQLRLEDTVTELEQMERVGLFTAKEIRTILKKRKALEYKLQKRTKAKEDYLKYIENEVHILDLVRKRRERIGYMFKKDDIDYSIAKRINRTFRNAVYRFQADVKLWMCHINFLKKMRWTDTISRIYTRMLQVHCNKPELWVEAAKWEMQEHKAAETARNIMLRALRFHPDSKLIFQEYMRLELKYIDRLLKRRRVLGLNDMENELEVSDAILEGKLVRLVYKTAIEKIPDGEFHVSLLRICETFKFAQKLQEEMLEDLMELHSDEESTWDYIARSHLKKVIRNKESSNDYSEADLEKCISVYEEAVSRIPSEKMWTFYIMTCMSIFNESNLENVALGNLVRALTNACNCNMLSEQLFVNWVTILETLNSIDEAANVLEDATKKFPKSVGLWSQRIKMLLRTDKTDRKAIQTIFNTATELVPTMESLPLWKLAIEWSILYSPSKVDDLLKRSLTFSPKLSNSLKTTYLEYTALNDGIESARDLYKRLQNVTPITEGFFQSMFAIEKSQAPNSIVRMRAVLQDTIFHFGHTCIWPWLEFIQLEQEHGDGQPENCPKVHFQALKTLNKDLESRFLTACTLRSIGNE